MTIHDIRERTYTIGIIAATALAGSLTVAYFALDGVGITDRVKQRFGLGQSVDQRVQEPDWNEPMTESKKKLCHLGERRDDNGYCIKINE